MTELVDEEEIQLKFTAPRWPGVYVFAVCLRSDSYFGFDQMHDIKVNTILLLKYSVICLSHY